MLWEIALVLFVVWLLKQRWEGRHLRELCKQFRTDLKQLPLVGCAHYFIGNSESHMSLLNNIARQCLKYNGWTAAEFAMTQYTMVADPTEAEHVMKTHLEKDDALKVSRDLFKNGLIFSPVAIWRPRRKVMAPTFSQHNLNQFVDIFYQQSCILVDKLTEVADGRTFSVWNYFTAYTLDSVCQTTMGVNVGAQKTLDHPFPNAFRKYSDIFAKRIMYPWLTNDVMFKYLSFGLYDDSKEYVKTLHNFTRKLIQEKREELAALKNKESSKTNYEKGSDFKPILELLIEGSGSRQQGYTDEELMEETLVLLLAGTDTSAVGLGFTALMLAQHPDLQEKVYNEIYELFDDADRPLKAEDLGKLSYLEAFVKETLRLYPSVPVTARKVVKKDITPAGVRLEPGLGVIISHWGLMRNPKYWGDDADEFRPERFFDSPPKHPHAFIPFSAGPRSCLGYKYAMLSIMMTTCGLLRRYKILPSGEDAPGKPLRIKYEVMMKHVNDFRIRLQPRK